MASSSATPTDTRTDTPTDARLHINLHGQLCLRLDDGSVCTGVVPVRAFPIAAPLEGISLVGPDGKEVLWLERLHSLCAADQALLTAALAAREFVPVITAIRAVDSISVPSRWQVDTDRGAATLVLKAEEDIRRLTPTHLLITSRDGVQYRIPDLTALDRTSHKRIERFL